MVKPQSVCVKVPATSANLGPGYDCIGLALDIWNEIEFSIAGNSLTIEIEGEGAETLPRDSENLIFHSMQIISKFSGSPLPSGLQIRCKNNIPVSSGMGSSATAVISGLLGAKAMLCLKLTDHELLKAAFDIEGHADNISSCLFGGLTITVMTTNGLVTKKSPIHPLRALIALPEIKISTHQARAVLPDFLAMEDAVYNLGRAALLVNSLQDGSFEFLTLAMQDQIHQPQRFEIIPGAEAAISGAIEAGALGAALSGAGPGVIAFVDKNYEEVSKALIQAFMNIGIQARIITSCTTNQGAQVQSL